MKDRFFLLPPFAARKSLKLLEEKQDKLERAMGIEPKSQGCPGAMCAYHHANNSKQLRRGMTRAEPQQMDEAATSWRDWGRSEGAEVRWISVKMADSRRRFPGRAEKTPATTGKPLLAQDPEWYNADICHSLSRPITPGIQAQRATSRLRPNRGSSFKPLVT